MASEKDFLKDLGTINQIGISPVIDRTQQTNLLGGSQMTKNINIGSMISNEAHAYLKDLKEEDLLAEIVFPDDIPADLAALFLNMIDATIATPSNDYRFANEDFNNGYMLIANKKKAEDFIKKYDNAENLSKDPVMAQFCAALSKTKGKIQIKPWIKEKTAEYLALLDDAREFNEQAFACCYTMRDKINFACSFCSDNFRISELSDVERKKEEICKHFILQNIRQIEKASDLVEQEVLLHRIIHSLVIETSILQRKNNELFRTTLGKLKMSNPLSMIVLLDNGEHVDFFELDKTKSYRLMNHINVSKAREFIDFSNCDINGHFTCSRMKVPIALPRSINYGLDCSYCCDNFINENTVFPKGVQIIDLTGTIKNFTDLAKLNLPETVKTIALTNSILNTALKKPEVLAEFRAFEQKYPNIIIIGDKPGKTLQALLEQAQAVAEPKKAEVIKPQNTESVKSVKPVIPEKTAEWLTRKEILGLFKDEPFADTDGLDRFLKRAINSNINIKSEDRMVDGNVVSCVHIDCLALLKEVVSHVIEEDLKHTKQKPTQTVKTTEHKQEKDQKKQKKQKPVRFKKYIPKQIWKEICASCNDSYGLLYSVLQRINLINIDYTKQALSGAIQYLDENRQIQVIPTLQKKKGCALAQNIEDRTKGAVSRRIVWTMNPKDKIIIAIKFCADHTDTTTAVQTYKNARTNAAKCNNMNGEPVTRELINQNIDNYYDVADLLKQYKPKEKPVVDVQTKTEKPKTQAKVRVATPSLNTKEKPKATLVDMTSLEYKVRAMIETLTVEIEKKNYRFTKLKSTDAKLKVWEEIKVCLDRKKRLEQELREMTK